MAGNTTIPTIMITDMGKLIITNCATDTSMYAEVPPRFDKSDALVASVEPAWRAGAAIVHIHAPPADFKAWESHTRAIRERCDILIQVRWVIFG